MLTDFVEFVNICLLFNITFYIGARKGLIGKS